MMLVPTSVHTQSGLAITDLGTLGGPFGEAEDINDVGHVVRSASPATGSNHAFLWTEAAGMTDLGTLGGSFSVAFAVNNQGQVVGRSTPAVGPLICRTRCGASRTDASTRRVGNWRISRQRSQGRLPMARSRPPRAIR
jgi:probable HAF family extracellular repeat protein